MTTRVRDWDPVAASNTQVGNVFIGEGWQANTINNAIREIMAQLRVESDTVQADITSVTTDFNSRLINTGTGLTGGGDLTADRTLSIANSGVNTAQIADDAVTSDKIADDAVTNDKIADDAVTASKIAANAVNSSEIAANAVGTSEIADNAVTAPQIAAGAVNNSELADNSVNNRVLTDNSVGTSEIRDRSITGVKIQQNTIGFAEMGAGVIRTQELADNSVTSAKIVNGAVGTDDLADNAVTADKLADDVLVQQATAVADLQVGDFVFAVRSTNNNSANFGLVYLGTNLRLSDTNRFLGPLIGIGRWRCLGQTDSIRESDATLFQRVPDDTPVTAQASPAPAPTNGGSTNTGNNNGI